MQHAIELTNYVEEATQALERLGLSIRWGRDFDLFKRIILRDNKRYAPAKGFDPEFYSSDGLDGIWLVAYRRSGELVHTQASRRVSIASGMRKHLLFESSAYEPAYLKFDLDRIEVNLSPDASKIRGDAIYHGEAWLRGGPDGIRGGPALYLFSRMMIAKALSEWQVEHIFGLITPLTGIKGLPQRYGYTRCEQGTLVFPDSPALPNDLWLVWMTAAEARMQLHLSPDYFTTMVAASMNRPAGKVA